MSKELEALQGIEVIIKIGLKDSVYLPKLGVVANTNKEALLEHVYLIMHALKRNEPMRVNLEGESITNIPGWFVCPKCQGQKVGYEDEYCCSCGQKLDWSDES